MRIENKKRFIINRLNGIKKDYAFDEDEIIYIGSKIDVKDKTKAVEYYLETDLGDEVAISKKDYEQLRACIGSVNNCEEVRDD